MNARVRAAAEWFITSAAAQWRADKEVAWAWLDTSGAWPAHHGDKDV